MIVLHIYRASSKKEWPKKKLHGKLNDISCSMEQKGQALKPSLLHGKNSSIPHAVPTEKKIESGDVITIDMGCKYNGYCSDMTRTIFVDEIQDYMKPVYDLVLKNQEMTLKQLYDGVNVKILSKMVENDFQFNHFDLVHALGHGVGLEVHENPVLSSRANDFILRENMVITDEPGIYLPR